MSIVTDTPRDWIKPLSILCPGDLNFEFHIKCCELSRGELGLGDQQTKGVLTSARRSPVAASPQGSGIQDSYRLNPTLLVQSLSVGCQMGGRQVGLGQE